MPFLYDTCAVSEFMQTRPHAKVVAYLSALPNEETYICTMSIGEILHGIELLPASTKRKRLEEWYKTGVLPSFSGRILPIDLAVMERWGPNDGGPGAAWIQNVDQGFADSGVRAGG